MFVFQCEIRLIMAGYVIPTEELLYAVKKRVNK